MLKKGWFIRCRCFWASFCFSTGHSTPALRYKNPATYPTPAKARRTWRELFDPGLFQQAIRPKPTNSIKGEHHTSHPQNRTSFLISKICPVLPPRRSPAYTERHSRFPRQTQWWWSASEHREVRCKPETAASVRFLSVQHKMVYKTAHAIPCE